MTMTHKYTEEIQNKTCWWCNGNHGSRYCNFESLIKKELKKKVGKVIENFVEKCIQCPRCSTNVNNFTFERLGNNTPSLDIECKSCGLQVEVKSKCLSVDSLPDNIYCKAGNYNMLQHNIFNNNLNIVIVIYSANRNTKNITIKEALWVSNNELRSNVNVMVTRENRSSLSNVVILNRNYIPKLSFYAENISFTSYIQKKSKELNLIH